VPLHTSGVGKVIFAKLPAFGRTAPTTAIGEFPRVGRRTATGRYGKMLFMESFVM